MNIVGSEYRNALNGKHWYILELACCAILTGNCNANENLGWKRGTEPVLTSVVLVYRVHS